MASTYSSRLRIELIGSGEQDGTWGTTLNAQLGTILEEAISGVASVTHDDSANYTLTTANGLTDEARQMVLEIGGTLTAARNLVCPTQEKIYVVYNGTTGGYAVTIKTSGGTGISIPNGEKAWVYCDGTNVVLIGFEYLAAEKTKLAGIETAATADQTGAEIKTAYEAESDTNAFTDAEKTKLAGIETAADVTDATNVDAAGAVMNTDTSTASMSFVVDEDTMSSNSATKVATQQSIKAYVDTAIAGVGGGTGGVVAVQTFTASGTYTRTSGVDYALVFAVGGGGGGAGGSNASNDLPGGGGGGAGEFVMEYCQPSSSETVTIGAGGAAGSVGATGNNGSAGGATSFGAHATANGGSGGAKYSTTQGGLGGAGGTGGTGTLVCDGGDGGSGGGAAAANEDGHGGHGGASWFGGGGNGAEGGESGGGTSRAGGAYGSGGGGNNGSISSAGGAGAGGCIIVIELAA